MDTNQVELPAGWFDDNSIGSYRNLVNQVPIGGCMVELGCWKGRSICSVSDIIKERNITVYLVDSFTGYDKGAGQYGDISTDIMEELAKNLIKFGLDKHCHIFPDTTERVFGALKGIITPHLVFIDADHTYEAVMRDIECWASIIPDGGVIAGHDFFSEGVNKALLDTFGHVENDHTVWRKTLNL